MFSRLFLFYICLISCFFNISLSLETKQNEDLLLQLKLKDYDIKFAEMEKLIAVQDRKLEQQNVRFVEMEKHIAKQETTIEKQNVQFAEHNRETLRLEILMEREKTKFAEQNRQIAVQNTLIANQKTMITEQNTKLCELKSQIETLQTSETKIKDQLAVYLQDINNIKMTTENMKNENSSNDNAVLFTRWGRSDCPRSTSTQVYNGTTGGGHYTNQGTSVNYVCMPHEPLYNKSKEFTRFSAHLHRYRAYLHGAEYETEPQSGLNNYEVPCAVCRAAPYSTKLMIPGRNKCYPGWEEAYHGELRSGDSNHKAASEYICLDQQAQRTGKNKFVSGKMLFPVSTQCGSLPCPPYEQSTLVTCVVCMK